MEENIAVQATEAAGPGTAAGGAQGFDALLKERDFQSEFDRRVSRALETARGKWMQETERRIEQARAEAEARARMTGEERMAHDFAERQKQLEAREMELTRRELRADAARILRERGLPQELAEMMHYANAEEMEACIGIAEQVFRGAVQSGINERLRGSAPVAANRPSGGPESDADYYRARYMPGSKPK